MALAVLSDEDIRSLLEFLTYEEAEVFSHSLKCALHEYSTGTQSIEAGLFHQPDRTSIHSNVTNATTLFMPSSSTVGHGIKVVTLSAPQSDPNLPTIKPTGSVTLYSPQGMPLGFLHAKTLTAFRTALASSCLLTKRQTVRTLTVFGSGLQAYWHIRLALMLRGHTIRNVYVINRRFSENAKLILKKFYAVPAEVKKREGWEEAQFSVLTPGYGEYGRLQKEHIRTADVIYCCTPSTDPLFDASILTSHEGRRKGRLIVAIGSYTPEMRELPREVLEQATRGGGGHMHFHKHATEGGVIVVDTLDGALREAGEIIEAGLEPKQLVELGELVMIHKARVVEEEGSLASQSTNGSSDVSDMDNLSLTPGSSAMSSVFGQASVDGSSKQSSSRTTSPSRSHSSSNGFLHQHKRRSSSQGSVDRGKQKRDDHMARWLTSGNVIYKSVGLGLMDLVVGMEVIRMAKEKGIGSHIEGFS
ncbi:ornithine cyclodeaminase [Xylariales sp. AK1849]|nr:ornithine cyclodeaminase [Xylariales sp. AK1849]